jgi:hypothetical protein
MSAKIVQDNFNYLVARLLSSIHTDACDGRIRPPGLSHLSLAKITLPSILCINKARFKTPHTSIK